MDVLPLLIGISIVVAVAVAGVFVWAVRSGQFDDLDTLAVRNPLRRRGAAGLNEREKAHSAGTGTGGVCATAFRRLVYNALQASGAPGGGTCPC